MKRKIPILISLLVVLILGLTVFISIQLVPSTDTGGNNVGTNEPPSVTGDGDGGSVGLSSYKLNDQTLNDDDLLEVTEDNKTNFKLVLDHEIDESRDYGVIVLKDYQQSPFWVNGDSVDDLYEFTASPQSKNELQIEMEVDENITEVLAFIIKEPHELVEEMDFDKLFYYEQVYTKRFILENAPMKDIQNVEPDVVMDSEGDQSVLFLSSQEEEEWIMSSASSNQLGYLHVGSPFTDQDMNYAIIAMQDWKQIKVLEDEPVLFTEGVAGQKKVFEVEFKEGNLEKENLQYIAFPYPYEVWSDKFAYKAEQSLRAVISD